MNHWNIDQFENKSIDLVAKIAPWFAPVPTAYLVGRATIAHLDWPIIVGILAATVIESLGLVTCATALDLYQFNQNRRKTDPPAPFWLAAFLVFLYFCVAVLLTVVLDTQPSWSVLAPAIFPFISLAGVTVIALRKDYQKRLQKIADEKTERKAERQANLMVQRQELKDLLEPAVSNDVSKHDQVDKNMDKLLEGRKAKLDNRLDRLLDEFRNNPSLGISDAARALNVSRQTIYSYMDQLEAAGKIHRNGHGVEVLK